MVKSLPKLRCPCCGKLSFFPSFVGFHKLDAFVLKIKGLGRGKGFRNTYEPAPIKGNLIDFWINRLQEVIDWLKMKRNPNLSMTKDKATLSQTQKVNYSNVSETYASPVETTVKSLSILTNPKRLSVQNLSPSISLKTNKYALTLKKANPKQNKTNKE
jgi:hypothetical protein